MHCRLTGWVVMEGALDRGSEVMEALVEWRRTHMVPGGFPGRVDAEMRLMALADAEIASRAARSASPVQTEDDGA